MRETKAVVAHGSGASSSSVWSRRKASGVRSVKGYMDANNSLQVIKLELKNGYYDNDN